MDQLEAETIAAPQNPIPTDRDQGRQGFGRRERLFPALDQGPVDTIVRELAHEALECNLDPIDEERTVQTAPGKSPTPVVSKRRRRPDDDTITLRNRDLKPAALSYLNALDGHDGHLIDAWQLSSEGCSESGQLFQDLHQTAPERARRLAQGLISMPGAGDEFLGFRLIEELGRGAFGRVYLALQGNLADRLVALKISTELPSESRTLAQLQHTNIVPIFSAHGSPPFHAVCMPYFGRTTLADLFDDLESQDSLPDSGLALLKTLGSRRLSLPAGSSWGSKPETWSATSVSGTVSVGDQVREIVTSPVQGPTPAVSETLRTIGGLSYVGAVLWVGARIADGLAHAHGRGILHRDLKPANVLMTDDGQPMILDFNLSEDTKQTQDASEASVGGTLPYMSPEAMERFLGSSTSPDARSDLYSLGVMLFELLTGRHPFEVYGGHSVSTIRRMIQDRKVGLTGTRLLNPAITPAVESILRHCLEPDPSRRYQSAAELREDLERQLTDLPLKHANEPSVLERTRKWARRNPRLFSTSSIGVVTAVLLGILGSTFLVHGRRLARFEAASEFAHFLEESSSVRFLLSHRTEDRARRSEGESLARQALERYHVLDDPEWTKRVLVANLPKEDRGRLRDEVAEVLLMLTQAVVLDASETNDHRGRQSLTESAHRLGQLALTSVPAGREPQALWAQQAALARLIGNEQDGARIAAEAERIPLRTARDYYLASTGLALRGEHEKALPLAEEATRLDPKDYWPWFVLGICHDRLEHHSDAMACFTTCIALRPEFADSWFNRGLAYLKRNDLDRARADFDRAAQLRPTWYEPPLNRALAFRDLGEHRRAENDLTRALGLGAPETRVYFLRAAARDILGDREGAKLDRQEGLKREPTDPPSWICRGMAKMGIDPNGALADFEAALKLDPRSLQALQMSAYVLSDLPGRADETIKVLNRAIELYPNHVPVRSGRGVELAILGRRDEALTDARESLWRDTSPAILYQVAGIYATTSKDHPEDRLEAYRLLSSALRAGFGFELIDDDHELDSIRKEPEFRALVESARAQAKDRLHRPPGR